MNEKFEIHEVEPQNLEKENRERFEGFLAFGEKNFQSKLVLDKNSNLIPKYRVSKNIGEEKIITSISDKGNYIGLIKGSDFEYYLHFYNNKFTLHTKSNEGDNFDINLDTPESVRHILNRLQKRFDQYEIDFERKKMQEQNTRKGETLKDTQKRSESLKKEMSI